MFSSRSIDAKTAICRADGLLRRLTVGETRIGSKLEPLKPGGSAEMVCTGESSPLNPCGTPQGRSFFRDAAAIVRWDGSVAGAIAEG